MSKSQRNFDSGRDRVACAALLSELSDFRNRVKRVDTAAGFAELRSQLRELKRAVDAMEEEWDRARREKQAKIHAGRTARHEKVARLVMEEGKNFKEVGKLIGVVGPRVRQLFHEYLKGKNSKAYRECQSESQEGVDWETRTPHMKHIRARAADFGFSDNANVQAGP